VRHTLAPIGSTVLLFVLSASGGCAPAAADSGARAEVRGVLDRFYELAASRKWNDLGDLLADDFQIFTDGGLAYGKADYVTLMKEDDLIVERMSLSDVRIEVSADGRMAWCTFRGSFDMASGGRRHDVRTAETLVFTRAAGGWAIVRGHASVTEASRQ
jgi:ketosteroid isomerase-like protein